MMMMMMMMMMTMMMMMMKSQLDFQNQRQNVPEFAKAPVLFIKSITIPNARAFKVLHWLR